MLSQEATTGLTVCCVVGDSSRRVGAMLEPLREVTTEIVLAVDDRLDADEQVRLRELADEVVPFDHRNVPERARQQLFALSTQPWILVVDTDEVVSGALVRALPGLLRADDVVQYRIARRWCFPDVGHWLDEVPWWPDFNTRLVRREFASMGAGTVHEGLAPFEPARYLIEPIYHLDCVLNCSDARAAKAARYEALAAGREPYGGGPFNETFYLPERFATRPPAPTPDEDLPSLHALVSAEPRTRQELLAEAPAPAATSSWDDDSYDAHIEVVERDTRFAPGEVRPLLVTVHNGGAATFPAGRRVQPEIRIAYRLFDGLGAPVTKEGLRTAFPAPLLPATCAPVPMEVQAPTSAGRYVLEIDLVHEGVRWFGRPTTVEIVVADRGAR